MENIFQPPPMLHALVYVHYVYSLGCTVDETPLFFKKLTGLINFACEFTQDLKCCVLSKVGKWHQGLHVQNVPMGVLKASFHTYVLKAQA